MVTMTTDYESPPHRSKKNTKRWCKGKVGREHVPGEWGTRRGMHYWWEKPCQNCGKILDYHIHWTKAENIPSDLVAAMAK